MFTITSEPNKDNTFGNLYDGYCQNIYQI